MCYEEAIARRLVAAYNRNPSRESYEISTNTIYPEYYSGEKNGVLSLDTESFAQFHRLIEDLATRGLFSAKQDKKTSVYKRITATTWQVKHLAGLYHLMRFPEYRERMRSVLSRYYNSDCPSIRNWVSGELEEGDLANVRVWFAYDISGGIAEKEKGLDELLSTCEAISKLREDVLMRNFSVNRAWGQRALNKR